MIVEIQCAPNPSGNATEPYAAVHAAIEVIERSGLPHEVGALGTSIEGDADEIWSLLRDVHEATFTAGAQGCLTVIKVFQQLGDAPATMASLTDRYR